MRKEEMISTIVSVLAVVVAILEFLFGQGILRNLKIDAQSNNQANIATSETNPDDSTTEPIGKPSESDSFRINYTVWKRRRKAAREV